MQTQGWSTRSGLSRGGPASNPSRRRLPSAEVSSARSGRPGRSGPGVLLWMLAAVLVGRPPDRLERLLDGVAVAVGDALQVFVRDVVAHLLVRVHAATRETHLVDSFPSIGRGPVCLESLTRTMICA